ncbi:MAG: DUF4982 domain-containing protein [Chitinispirillaceae bacterium]|nr:DUF4982 domain-containing protein [Chitinispirillaceae bacterium]
MFPLRKDLHKKRFVHVSRSMRKRYRLLVIVAGLAAMVPVFAGNDVTARQKVHFSELWKFYRGDARGAEAVSFDDAEWETVCLPHTVRLESAKTHTSYDYYQGYCWYRKSFVPPESFRGRKVLIEFEAAMQSTEVYFNGKKIGGYLGGYNPFLFDITDALQFGVENVCAVKLDNRVNGNVSPGNPAPDFFYYGGLYRYVNLHLSDRLHITNAIFADKVAGGGVFVTTPSVSTGSADVQIKTHIINEYSDSRNVTLTTTVLDSAATATIGTGNEIRCTLAAGDDTTITQRVTVNGPNLWHPDHPYLYRIRSRVYDGERPADELLTSFGIRTIAFSRSGGCTINGKRLLTRGANRHQDYGAIGNAVPVSGQYRDALLLKEGGFNFVRLSHYLQHPAFLDACDRLGIVVQASLVGWQHNGFSNSTFVQNSLRDLRTMIRYYRNHPSIIMWESVHNESNPPESFARSAQQAAHEEYPGNQMFTTGQESNNIMDIYQAAVQQGGRTYSTGKPAGISEYAHWEEGGFQSTSNRTRADGEAGLLQQAKNHVSGMDQNHQLSWLAFDAVWVFNDYFGMSQYARSLCSGGVIDLFRIPKFSYYCYRAQRDPSIVFPGVNSGPAVFIASYWTGSSSKSVWVFSNCEKVALYLNNTLVETRSPDNKYATIGNPTFTFTLPSFQAGTLKADGLIGGTAVVSHTVRTPEAAAKVAVAVDTAGLRLLADGADLAIVYASVVDANGTVLPGATNRVTFSVAGPGKILSGDGNPVAAEGGIAAVYVQTKYAEPGLITVTASAEGLTAGNATVQSVPMSEPTTGTVTPHSMPPVRQRSSMRINGSSLTIGMPHAATGSSPYRFSLYDQLGRLVRCWNVSPGKGNIDVRNVPCGIYCGRLIAGNDGSVMKSGVIVKY